MGAWIEVWKSSGPELVNLEGDRLTIGKAEENDIAADADPTMSRMHAILERYPAGWCVRDVGSRNGTTVNGERIWAERLLRPGDEIIAGRTRIVFRSSETVPTETQAAQAPPELTRRERDVLIALCAPLMSVDVFTEPAPNRDIAQQLVVTEAAVRLHMQRLYDKFGIHEEGERRRVRLANEAIRRGAVTVTDLRKD